MDFYKAISEAQAKGTPISLCTIVKSSGSTPRRIGSKMLVYESGDTIGSVGGGAVESLVFDQAMRSMLDGKSAILSYSFTDPQRGDPGVCGGQMEVYVEPIITPITIVVLGAGHVGRAIAHLAPWMGYRLIVWDDRSEYASPDDFPLANQVINGSIESITSKINIDQQTKLILTTRNIGLDIKGIPEFLKTKAGYIGVIGSKRRWETAKKKMIKNGLSETELARVVSPIGLNLNGETPEEIAISVFAEIIMLANGGDESRKGAS